MTRFAAGAVSALALGTSLTLAAGGPAAAVPTMLALVVELAAAVTFGSLLLHIGTCGVQEPTRAPHAVQAAGAVWALVAVGAAVLEPGTRGFWVASAVLGAVVAVAGLRTASWTRSAALTGVAGLGVVVGSLAISPARGPGADLGSNAVALFALAGAAWLGALVSLPREDSSAASHLVKRRYRAIATTSAAVLVGTGAVLVFTHWSGLPVPVLAVVMLAGAVGLGHVLSPVRWRPGALPTLVALVVGAGAALRLLAGIGTSGARSPAQLLLGYGLNGRPTVAALATHWRFDLVLGSASVVLAVAYLLGLRVIRSRGDHWPPGRTASWLLGCLALLVTTSSGIGAYGRGMFSVYMVVHMSLSMFVPVLLVLGGPVTLALRTLPHGGVVAGPREWLLTLLHSGASRVLTNPLGAVAVFLVTLYGVYFTGVFTAAQQHPWGYELLNVHFLVSGYLFYYGIIGIDPGPARPPFLARLGVLFAVMPFHAFFGIALMSMSGVIGEGFYRTLALPWVGDVLSDEHTGGAIAWVSGEVPLLLVALSLLTQWSRQDERTATRADRHADSDGDSERLAYNAMLSDLARSRR